MSIYAGHRLRHLRDRLKLSLRDVEIASSEIAARHGNQEFFIPFGRLSEIEIKGVVPSIHRIYSLAAIYHCDHRRIMGWYEVDFDTVAQDSLLIKIPTTHRFKPAPPPDSLMVPIAVDPAFDVRRTMNLGRMIQKWGMIPLQFLDDLKRGAHTYGFIGTSDYTMYPLLMPGSFLQIDERRTEVLKEGWRSEYERPIYFIETREEFICSWCNISDRDELVTQPHPLSPVSPRVFRHREEAEVVGQVVGVAMRLTDLQPGDNPASATPPAQLN